MRALLAQQLLRMRPRDLLAQTAVMLANQAAIRLGMASPEHADREQAREAIDALAGVVDLLVPLSPPDEVEALRRDLAQLRMAFVQSGAAPAPPPGRLPRRPRRPRTSRTRSARRSGRPGARSSAFHARVAIDARPAAPARIPRTRRRGGRMAAEPQVGGAGEKGCARGRSASSPASSSASPRRRPATASRPCSA